MQKLTIDRVVYLLV